MVDIAEDIDFIHITEGVGIIAGGNGLTPLLLQHPVNRLSITSAHRKGPCARLNGADTSTPVFALTGQTLANRVHAAANAAGLGRVDIQSGYYAGAGMVRNLASGARNVVIVRTMLTKGIPDRNSATFG